MSIRKVAVIGAGTMGTGIACHVANAGVPCLLLDIVPKDLREPEGADHRARSRLAVEALGRAAKGSPSPFMDPRDAERVEAGNLTDDLPRLAECDWIIEAVTEDLAIKRDVFSRIASHRRPGTILSSNTSGISLSLLVDGMSDELRRHFLITHFFNPPRWMYLLEMVRGPDTDPRVYDEIERFATVQLGKGVVECKDTPNFIANRIGIFSMAAACRHMIELDLSVEEVDAIAGPPLGRPKTAVFKLHDLVGIDVALLVLENVRKLIPHDESLAKLEPPEFLTRMVAERLHGRKTGAGFYKKEGRDILVLDLKTFAYRAPAKVEYESLARARKERTTAERIKALVAGDDKAARFAWKDLSETIAYAARLVPEISDDIVSIDRAMRWGFNWELGPFETWDALGVRATADRLRSEGREVPALVQSLLDSGHESFYSVAEVKGERRRTVFAPARRAMDPLEPPRGVILLDDVRVRREPVKSNRAASLWDLGDGVLGVEFHSKMNAISQETLDLLREAVDVAESGGWAGIVVGNQAPNFSAGADLKLLLEAARAGEVDRIDALIRAFHETALRVRYSTRPVVAAIHGLCLGGGCEIPLSCHRIQAAAETSIGLVELGVGLIPAGGGTRELACRIAELSRPDLEIDTWPHLRHAFDAVARGKVSASADEARRLGYLREGDGITMNRQRVIADAKRRVIALAEEGFRPPRPRDRVRIAGRGGLAELRILIDQFLEGGFISEYDAYLAERFAYVLCGGGIDSEHTVSERWLLDLERHVFLELCGQEKTLERIEHMLKTGKPLRN